MAALAATSMVFKQSDPAYATQLLTAATNLYAAVSATSNLGSYYNIPQPDCRNAGDPDTVSALASQTCQVSTQSLG